MVLNYKNGICEWRITEDDELDEIRRLIKKLPKIEKDMKKRLAAESFTNMFESFDDDIEVRNFIYLFRGESNNIIILDEKKRKIQIHLNEITLKMIETWNQKEVPCFECDNVIFRTDSNERIMKCCVIYDLFGTSSNEFPELSENLLEQIILLEEMK